MKLTSAQRDALEWIAANEPVCWFPCDGSGPTHRQAKKLFDKGLLLETRPVGAVGMYGLSAAGAAALDAAPATSHEKVA